MNWGEQITTRHLTPKQVNKICREFIMGKLSPPEIAKLFKVNYAIINRIQAMFVQMYRPSKNGTVSMNLKTRRHYPKESHILEELELNYDNVELTGWELEQLNKLSL